MLSEFWTVCRLDRGEGHYERADALTQASGGRGLPATRALGLSRIRNAVMVSRVGFLAFFRFGK